MSKIDTILTDPNEIVRRVLLRLRVATDLLLSDAITENKDLSEAEHAEIDIAFLSLLDATDRLTFFIFRGKK